MKEQIKQQIKAGIVEMFIPAVMFIWGIGLGLFSIFLVISALWSVFSIF
jgi:hypothetical protein